MADEFMRFLVRTEELNNLAKIKRLITVSKDYSFDEVFAPLSKSTPIYLGELGLIDSAISQMRTAVQQVMIGNLTVEQAVENYGSFK
jgi:multiple sugar transport system substrate-binding protein